MRSASTKAGDAKRLLKRRGKARPIEGRPVIPRVEKVTVGELLDALTAEYEANGRRSLDRLAVSLAHLRPVFGARARRPCHERRRHGLRRRRARRRRAQPTRRSTGSWRRSSGPTRLALDAERLHRAPRIPDAPGGQRPAGLLRARRSSRPSGPARCRRPPRARDGRLHHRAGACQSELQPLQWRQVDFKAGTLRLEPGHDEEHATAGCSS